jgi:uncharacterized protein YdcH (DUF465 family)
MEMAQTETIREELMNSNPEFRTLVQKHQVFEDRISILSNLNYPSDEEQQEEHDLKKKKLLVKDEIYSMISKFNH